jgi:hypothetical protein
MKTYQAVLTGGDTRDIGQFPSLNAAQVWALQEFGGNLADVREVTIGDYQIVVNHAELDPAWYVLALAGLLLLLAEKKRRKKKRGANVRK